MIITRKSPLSGKVNSLDLPVTQDELDYWKDFNILIQDAFPNLTPAQREFLLTGIPSDEWDAAFKDDE